MELQLHKNNLFQLLSFSCKRLDFYKASSIKWNDKTNKMELQNSKRLKWLQARFIYSFIYCSIGAYSVVTNWSESGSFVKTYGVFGLCGYFWALPSIYMMSFNGHQVVNLFNSMIQFEQRELSKIMSNKDLFFVKNVKVKKEHMMKLICKLMALTSHWCFIFHSNSLLHPCFPINVGYNFSENCENGLGLNGGNFPLDNSRELLVRLAVVSCGLFMWVTIVGNLTGICVILILTGHCISSYINYFTRFSKQLTF